MTEWTKTPPTELGWYWHRLSEYPNEPAPVSVFYLFDRLHMTCPTGARTIATAPFEWWPKLIPEPPLS